MKEEPFIVAAPNHDFAPTGQLRPEDLTRTPLLFTDGSCPFRASLNRILHESGLNMEGALEVGSIEAVKQRAKCSEDAVPRPLGFFALIPIPVTERSCWGPVRTGPSLVLAPESVLRLLPSALSPAPAVGSVSGRAVFAMTERKKLDVRSAFRHGPYRTVTGRTNSAIAVLNLVGSSTNGSCLDSSNQTSLFEGAVSTLK